MQRQKLLLRFRVKYQLTQLIAAHEFDVCLRTWQRWERKESKLPYAVKYTIKNKLRELR